MLNELIEEISAIQNDLYTMEVVFQDESSIDSNDVDKKLTILHFNDVYNIESSTREPKGGAARLFSLVKHLKEKHTNSIVLFSGDCFSPSALSMITKGKQMIPILNRLNVAAACVGNHDFDFGVECLEDSIGECNFPWLLSNVVDSDTKTPLASTCPKHIVFVNGLKIGIIGIIEQEWIETLSTIDFDDIIYEDFAEAAERLATELKQKDKCDYVIALTHMRLPNDMILAEESSQVDLILGGHDHDVRYENTCNKWIVKSGTDFKDLSLVELVRKKSSKKILVSRIEHYTIDSKINENDEIASIVSFYLSQGDKELDKVIGVINVDLDGRFHVVRTSESNLGNFICDIILENIYADCAIINSGTIRSDCVNPSGEFTLGDLKKIIPFPDPVMLLLCTGRILLAALENSVSQYPKLEGRFPQVGGIHFAFDPSKPSGSRIDPKLVKVQNEPLDLERDYKLAVKQYMREGKDGYTMFSDCQILIDDEDAPLLFNTIENHFKNISKIKTMPKNVFVKRPSLVPITKRNSIITDLLFKTKHIESRPLEPVKDEVQLDTTTSLKSNSDKAVGLRRMSKMQDSRKLSLQQSLNLSQHVLNNIKKSDAYIKKIHEFEQVSLKVAPKVEGRIVCIKNKEMMNELLEQYQNS